MRDGQFRGRRGIRVGGIEDHDPALGGRFDIDVVHADPGASDHPQARGRRQDRSRDSGAATDDDRVAVRDAGHEGLGTLARGHHDLETRPGT